MPGYLNYPNAVTIGDIEELIHTSMGSEMEIVFSKKTNGKIRIMTCRTMGSDQPPPPTAWKKNHSDLMFVYEINEGVKAVSLERILCLKVLGLKYYVKRERQIV